MGRIFRDASIASSCAPGATRQDASRPRRCRWPARSCTSTWTGARRAEPLMPTIISAGHVVLPDHIAEHASLVIDGDRIVDVRTARGVEGPAGLPRRRLAGAGLHRRPRARRRGVGCARHRARRWRTLRPACRSSGDRVLPDDGGLLASCFVGVLPRVGAARASPRIRRAHGSCRRTSRATSSTRVPRGAAFSCLVLPPGPVELHRGWFAPSRVEGPRQGHPRR